MGILRILKNILFVSIPALTVLLVLMEIASRILFPGREVPKTVYDERDRIVKFSREYGETGLWTKGKFAQVRARWRINNDGWNSPIDYFAEKNPGVLRIAVIGDSYIEAMQVDADKKYPSLLGDCLGGGYEVYSFGTSGSPLSQYLHVSRYVDKKYSPDIYIFNLIHNDFNESINGVIPIPMYLTVKIDGNGAFTEIQPVKPEGSHRKMPGGMWFRKSSFFRYVYFNLNLIEKFRTRGVSASEAEMNVVVSDVLDRKDAVSAVTGHLLAKIKTELGSKEVVFIMDTPRWSIYKGELGESNVIWLNGMVAEHCRELNLRFIDLTPYVLEDYEKNKTRFETDVDGHWSEYGHRFVAGVLCRYFRNSPDRLRESL